MLPLPLVHGSHGLKSCGTRVSNRLPGRKVTLNSWFLLAVRWPQKRLLHYLPRTPFDTTSPAISTARRCRQFSTDQEHNIKTMAEPLNSRAAPLVERVADSMECPALDDRSYRVVKLPNELEALLIHDPETDKASGALDVNVGAFSDSTDMPGLAHAVEHMLFMGTEKVEKIRKHQQFDIEFILTNNMVPVSEGECL